MKRAIGVLAVVLFAGAAGCSTEGGSGNVKAQSTPDGGATTTTTTTTTTSGVTAGAITLPNGLKYEDLRVGEGPVANSGMKVSVHYTGWLTDGTKFDSSLDRNEPFNFTLGGGNVIRGWDEGVKGMKVGGKRKLTIPPDLGYGAAGQGPIPPNSTLVFEVELLNVQ